MSNYSKTTDFEAKDSLPTGDSGKIIRGSEFETEFDAISTAIATKADTAGPTFTGTLTFETISDGTINVTAFVDEDNMASNSATLVPTQQSVKAYVDSQLTAQDLDFQADSGGALSIDLDSETMTFTGGTGIDTSGSGNAVTFAIDSTVATLTGSQTLTNKTLTSPDVNTPDIDGGTIDNTVIGGSTAAAGSFTTVSATGNITVGGTVDGRDVATDGSKLDGIEASATADQTASEIRTLVESASDSNVFTDADHSKLDGIEASATADQTDAEIRAAVEAASDSNVFTDADHSKLDGIEASADVTDTANVTAAGALMDSELTSIASVKALNQGVSTSDSPTFAGLTTTANVSFGDNDRAVFGAGNDLEIYHTGSVSVIEDSGTGNLLIRGTDMRLQNAAGSNNYLKAVDGAEVSLFFAGGQKLATTGSGIDVTGVITTDGLTTSADINFGDNDKAVFGAGSDLQIFHDGSTSIITDQGTGFLALRGDGNVSLQSADGTENKLVASTDGAVTLYHDNSAKLATTSTGIDVTGTAVTDGLTVAGNTSLDGGTIKLDGNFPTGTENVALGNTALNAAESGANFNIAIGSEALLSLTTGDNNTGVGHDALRGVTTSSSNTGVGFQAGRSITTGTQNTLLGNQAGFALTDADFNVAIGHGALSADTLGNTSTAVGRAALNAQNFTSATSSNNTAVGYHAGLSVTTGTSNILVGSLAGDALTDADSNVAVGQGALSGDTLGSHSVALGHQALNAQNFSSATNSFNVAVGSQAGHDITTGIQNTLLGGLVGDSLTDGDFNVAVGYAALDADTLGSKSTAIGKSALTNQNFTSATDSHNTAVGFHSGLSVSTGTHNTFVGSLAGDALTVGSFNTALGYGALSADTQGQQNVAIGYQALASQNFTSATDSHNTAVGFNAGGAVTTGTNNTLIGSLAGDAITTAIGSTAVGLNALTTLVTGNSNTAIGYNAGKNFNGVGSNTVVGADALDGACGQHNTVVGASALGSVNSTDATGNTAVGRAAGFDITSGANNIALGEDALRTGSPGGSQGAGDNKIGLGDENITSFHCQVALTVASDQRDKTDFVDLDLGLDFVKALEPVTYYWDKRSKYGDKYAEDYDLNAQVPDGTHKEDWMDVGFKAQSVLALEEAAGHTMSDKKNLTVSLSDDGKQYGLQYEKFVPILVKAIQEQQALIESLTARIATLEG